MLSGMNQMQLSVLALQCMLKLSLTIADLEGKKLIGSHQLIEALEYHLR